SIAWGSEAEMDAVAPDNSRRVRGCVSLLTRNELYFFVYEPDQGLSSSPIVSAWRSARTAEKHSRLLFRAVLLPFEFFRRLFLVGLHACRASLRTSGLPPQQLLLGYPDQHPLRRHVDEAACAYLNLR